jgi:hypothetical protein
MEREVCCIHRTEEINLESLEIRFCNAVSGKVKILSIIDPRIGGNFLLAFIHRIRSTEINPAKLLLGSLEKLDVLLPFGDICLDKNGIALAEFSHEGLPLRGIHIDDRELPSFCGKIIDKCQSDALITSVFTLETETRYLKHLQ